MISKETTIAAFLGIGAGVIIAIVIIFSSKFNSIKKEEKTSLNISPTIVKPSNVSPEHTLEITAPKDNTSIESNLITIEGIALEKSILILSSAYSEKIITNKNAKFSIEFPLQPGKNDITVSNIINGDIKTKTVTVFYTYEK